tara:strand:+ start:175 stop:462 length:288 start_codon:yes stop_codon:yes gene_type:complete
MPTTTVSKPNTTIPIKAFDELTQLCLKHNWTLVEKNNELIYKLNKNRLTFRFFEDNIEVSIPLTNGEMNYKTKFDSYFKAIEYGIDSFKYYIDTK